MFFVYEIKFDRTGVVGGTSSILAAKELAEKRAKKNLVWNSQGGEFSAQLDMGTYKVTYLIEPDKRR